MPTLSIYGKVTTEPSGDKTADCRKESVQCELSAADCNYRLLADVMPNIKYCEILCLFA